MAILGIQIMTAGRFPFRCCLFEEHYTLKGDSDYLTVQKNKKAVIDHSTETKQNKKKRQIKEETATSPKVIDLLLHLPLSILTF